MLSDFLKLLGMCWYEVAAAVHFDWPSTGHQNGKSSVSSRIPETKITSVVICPWDCCRNTIFPLKSFAKTEKRIALIKYNCRPHWTNRSWISAINFSALSSSQHSASLGRIQLFCFFFYGYGYDQPLQLTVTMLKKCANYSKMCFIKITIITSLKFAPPPPPHTLSLSHTEGSERERERKNKI